jgi:hypothetical protein
MAGLDPATQRASVREPKAICSGIAVAESFATPTRGCWVAGRGPAMVRKEIAARPRAIATLQPVIQGASIIITGTRVIFPQPGCANRAVQGNTGTLPTCIYGRIPDLLIEAVAKDRRNLRRSDGQETAVVPSAAATARSAWICVRRNK